MPGRRTRSRPRRMACERNGLSRDDGRKRLGTAVTVAASTESEPAMPVQVAALVGRNTFTAGGERSNETPQEPSNEGFNELSHEAEDSWDRAPYDTSSVHVNGTEEDWWNGTD
ncbi:hypothetical protein [Krasilnikovia sp. M28-CT-15]|uniref:hypothetical protein n=1 Tax=Krasilnikovia sp. M28-CT-15 TaxID=3373540 RepID=UPI00399CE091